MPFLAVCIDLVERLDPEAVEAACFDAGALSVTLTDLGDDPVLEPAPGEIRLWRQTRLRALFAADAASPALISNLCVALELEPSHLEVTAIEDRVWEREWLRDFHAMRFGTRLWIAPSHEPVLDTAAVVVTLDPGLAFGTGTHPTTALCLEWLDSHPPEGARVIDFGCGSGVLGIAAVKLGAARVWGWDIDPQARLATRENAERNEIAAEVTVAASEASLPQSADLLLANILAGPLIALAPRFAALLRPQGQLVISGLLEADAVEVTRAYAPWFDMSSSSVREGWVCLAGERRVHDLP